MKKEGYVESTIERYVRLLNRLAGYAGLNKPEGVEVALTKTS